MQLQKLNYQHNGVWKFNLQRHMQRWQLKARSSHAENSYKRTDIVASNSFKGIVNF